MFARVFLIECDLEKLSIIANTFFLTTPAVSVARHDVSTGLPQPFSSKQQKKKRKCQPFLNLLLLFLELSGRCGASSRRSCGNVTYGVDVGVLCIKRSVSRVKKNMKTGEAQKRKVQCNNAYRKNRSNLGDGSEFGKFA